MAQDKEDGTSRRDFLKLGAAAPAMVAATASGAAAEPAQVDLNANKIQDTAHTRAYLASARF